MFSSVVMRFEMSVLARYPVIPLHARPYTPRSPPADSSASPGPGTEVGKQRHFYPRGTAFRAPPVYDQALVKWRTLRKRVLYLGPLRTPPAA